MHRIHNEFHDLFAEVKESSLSYLVPSTRVVYALQKPIKKELDRLQKQQLVVILGVHEMSGWCNSFVLVPKAHGKV